MALSKKEMAKVLKVAAIQIKAALDKASAADAEIKSLRDKIAANEKLSRARTIATKLVVGDDVRREIDEKTRKMASQDLDVVEKALELGRQEAVLKIGEAIVASQTNTGNNSTQGNALVDCLVSLI